MTQIGGNVNGVLQTYRAGQNEIGESVKVWENAAQLWGFIDQASGNSGYTTFSAKVQESTHMFLCDYTELPGRIQPENSRMVIDGKAYDVMLIDNPMGLNAHLEIYLRYTGGM